MFRIESRRGDFGKITPCFFLVKCQGKKKFIMLSYITEYILAEWQIWWWDTKSFNRQITTTEWNLFCISLNFITKTFICSAQWMTFFMLILILPFLSIFLITHKYTTPCLGKANFHTSFNLLCFTVLELPLRKILSSESIARFSSNPFYSNIYKRLTIHTCISFFIWNYSWS